MKRIYLIIILCLVLTGQAQAQRHFPGLLGVQARVGVADGFHLNKGDKQAYCFGIMVNKYTQNGRQWGFGAEYMEKKYAYKDILIPIRQYTGDITYFHTVARDKSATFYLTAGISGMAGYEQINKGKKLLYDGASIINKDKFIGGGAFTLEAETFITDRLVFTLTARERALLGSDTGNFHFSLSAGIRVVIN